MRLFRRAGDTKTSVVRREDDARIADDGKMERAQMQVIANDTNLAEASLPSVDSETSVNEHDESDVFVCQREVASTREIDPRATEVTLFVYGWHNVQPGPLSWQFPSMRAALDSVRKMRNATAWCIVAGSTWDDVGDARAAGAILVEQLA